MILTARDNKLREDEILAIRRKKEKKRKKKAKQVSCLSATGTRGSPQHLFLRKKQRESPYNPTLINQTAPTPQKYPCPLVSHHPNTLNYPSTPLCTPILLLPGGGERNCPSPPARCSCAVRGSMLGVIIHERA